MGSRHRNTKVVAKRVLLFRGTFDCRTLARAAQLLEIKKQKRKVRSLFAFKLGVFFFKNELVALIRGAYRLFFLI